MDKDFLLSLNEAGAGLIPLYDDGRKYPPITWTPYMPSRRDGTVGTRPTKDLISQWCVNYKNIGMITGWKYYALDFDTIKIDGVDTRELHPETAKFLDFLLRNTNSGVHVNGKRYHLIYEKDPSRLLSYSQHPPKYPGLEVFGESHILRLPGCINKDKQTFIEERRSLIDNKVDIFPYEYLVGEISIGNERKIKQKPLSNGKIQITSRHNDARDYYTHLMMENTPLKIIDKAYLDHINANYPEVLGEEEARQVEFLEDIPRDVPNFEIVKEKDKQANKPLVDFSNILGLETLLDKEFPPVEEIVGKCFLSGGGIAAFVGDPGVGKSFAALDLMDCLSTGRNWLGHPEFIIKNTLRCLYLDGGESTNAKLQRRYKFLNFTRNSNVRLGTIDLTFIRGREEDNNRKMDLIISNMKTNGETVVILDSMRRFHNYKEGDPDEMKMLFKTLARVREHGILLILIHHNRKGIHGAAESEMQKVSGSLEISANVDHLFTFTKLENDKVRFKQSKQRDLEEYPPIEVDFGKDLKGNLKIHYLGNYISPEKAIDNVEDTIRTYLQECGKKTRQDILDLVKNQKGGSAQNVDKILSQLKKDGFVKTIQDGKMVVYEHL